MYGDIANGVKKYLTGLGVSEQLATEFVNATHLRSYAAKDIIIQSGDRYPPTIYVLSGYLKTYTIDDDGELWVHYLIGPFRLYGSLPATLGVDGLAKESVECISDCQVIYIDWHLGNRLLNHPEFIQVVQRQVIRRLMKLAAERAHLLRLRAIDRYQYFIDQHPEIHGMVPEKDIASFIGIRPQSLSRIKNNLAG